MEVHSQSGMAVLPGDSLNDAISKACKEGSVYIGRGLATEMSSSSSSSTEDSNDINIMATMAGKLRFQQPGDFWVDCSSSRLYLPAVGDKVVGVVVTAPHSGGDFVINIRAGCNAVLRLQKSQLKEHLDLKKGAVIFCQVVNVPADMDVELACDKTWSAGKEVYGVLKESVNIYNNDYQPTALVYVPLSYTRYLLNPNCVLLKALATHFAFEMTVGANGVVWIKAARVGDLVVIRNCLLNCQNFDDCDVPGVVDKLVSKAGAR
jgi:exosome complex component RRP40